MKIHTKRIIANAICAALITGGVATGSVMMVNTINTSNEMADVKKELLPRCTQVSMTEEFVKTRDNEIQKLVKKYLTDEIGVSKLERDVDYLQSNDYVQDYLLENGSEEDIALVNRKLELDRKSSLNSAAAGFTGLLLGGGIAAGMYSAGKKIDEQELPFGGYTK